MHPLWKVLPFTRENTAPPFLVCVQFDRESYEIYLTDLTHCWKENAHREDIIRRSQECNTPIDPSEDAQQMQLFLDKLRSAFTGSLDTGLKIKAVKSKKPMMGSDLSIEASAVLPRPLKPLLWPMHFERLPESEFTNRVTIPLFEAQNARLAEIESLLGTLREKDHVIQKLVDKLDASGTDLGQIFPRANGKGGRKISRQDAEAKVKGLGAFTENTWRKEMENNNQDHHHWENIADLIGDNKMKFPLANGGSGIANWFEWLDVSKKAPLDSRFNKDQLKSKVDHKTPPKPSQDDIKNESDGEDDFQVQATPPHQQSSTKKKDYVINADSDDEDDLDAPSQRSISQRSVIPDSVPIEPSTQPSSKPKKLGTIGGIQKPSKSRSLSPPQPSPPVIQSTDDAVDDDQATATEDEAPTPPPAKPKKMGLGMIGGKKKEVTLAVEPAPPSPKDIVQENPAPGKKAKGRLGMIGHKAKEVETVKEDEPRGRAPKKEATPPPPPRETSLERADRKRQELKRELEEKAKAPVKKKRKF